MERKTTEKQKKTEFFKYLNRLRTAETDKSNDIAMKLPLTVNFQQHKRQATERYPLSQ